MKEEIKITPCDNTLNATRDKRGELDSVVLRGRNIYIDRMGDRHISISIELEDGTAVLINTGVYRKKWYFNATHNGGSEYEIKRPV